jgi:hypothetical protein
MLPLQEAGGAGVSTHPLGGRLRTLQNLSAPCDQALKAKFAKNRHEVTKEPLTATAARYA